MMSNFIQYEPVPVVEKSLSGCELPAVLMVLEDLGDLGGGEKQAWRLAQALRNRKLSVEMVTACWHGQNKGCQVVDGVPIHYLISVNDGITRWRGGRHLSRYLMIIALFFFLWRNQNKYQILHFHESDFLAATGVLVGRLLKKRVITKVRTSGKWNDLETVRKQWLGIERVAIVNLLQQADRTVSLNEESTQELVAAGFSSSQIVRFVNGIDPERFTSRSAYTLHVPPKLLFVGRLQPQKDVKTLFEALTLVGRSDVQILLAGDGFQRQYLEELAGELSVRDRVTFLGRVSNVLPYLQMSDLFVLPSLAEGISNALLEAMACGLPCLATDISGNRVVIHDEENGYLFPPGDSVVLAQLINNLLADETLRRRIGQAGRATVVSNFSIDQVAQSYLALYRQLSSSGRGKHFLTEQSK